MLSHSLDITIFGWIAPHLSHMLPTLKDPAQEWPIGYWPCTLPGTHAMMLCDGKLCLVKLLISKNSPSNDSPGGRFWNCVGLHSFTAKGIVQHSLHYSWLPTVALSHNVRCVRVPSCHLAVADCSRDPMLFYCLIHCQDAHGFYKVFDSIFTAYTQQKGFFNTIGK